MQETSSTSTSRNAVSLFSTEVPSIFNGSAHLVFQYLIYYMLQSVNPSTNEKHCFISAVCLARAFRNRYNRIHLEMIHRKVVF